MMRQFTALWLALVGLWSCTSIYYNFWEILGQEKRDILKSNLKSVRAEQEGLSEDIVDTLDKIRKEYKFDGGELEKTYQKLSADYERARSKAQALRDRIAKVDRIAEDLFAEWEAEAKTISNITYREDSLQQLSLTKKRFAKLSLKMHRVEQGVQPVLTRFNDQVLYLKHNLNARAVGVLQAEFGKIEKDIQTLVVEIEKVNRETDSFIDEIN